MDNYHKIVMQFPLTSLWTDNEDILAERGRYLTAISTLTASPTTRYTLQVSGQEKAKHTLFF